MLKQWVVPVLVCLLVFAPVGIVFGAGEDTLQDGVDRLEDLQNNDGGWDWPLNDGNPNNTSPKNTLGPIARGLGEANSGIPSQSLFDAGGLLLSKTNNFSPPDGYLAKMLDDIFGGTTYRDHVLANFYGPLVAGTYNRNGLGVLYDTASYIASIYTSRSSWGGGNLAAWDVGMGLAGAVDAGADPTDWIAGTKTEINRLVQAASYDVLGLAGALYGLSCAGEEFDPMSGAHAAADNLIDLGDILASYQIPDGTGGFSWRSDYLAHGNYDETVQETAYAVLALGELDRARYLEAIVFATNWLIDFQLATGGSKNWEGGGENNQVTGEALWAIVDAYMRYNLSLPDAILYTELLFAGLRPSEAMAGLRLMSNFPGFSVGDVVGLVDEYGSFRFRHAVAFGGRDLDWFNSLLLGFATEYTLLMREGKTHFYLSLTDQITGEEITISGISVTLVRDSNNEIILFGAMSYDEGVGQFVYSFSTTDLDPGDYLVYIGNSTDATNLDPIPFTIVE